MGSFSRYAPDDIAISTDKITTNTWIDDTNKLTTFFTSSKQANYTSSNSQGQFFIDVYKTEDPAGVQTTSSAEFSVSYGHKAGSGSENFTNTTGSIGNTATKCTNTP